MYTFWILAFNIQCIIVCSALFINKRTHPKELCIHDEETKRMTFADVYRLLRLTVHQ